MMGWDPVFLQDAVNQCTNLSGQITDCPLFDIQSEDAYSNCNITLPSAILDEDVVGAMPTIPGNVPIVSGPAPANGATAGGSQTTGAPAPVSTTGGQLLPTLSYSAGSSLAPTDTYIPGGIFAVSVSQTPTITTPPAPTSSSSNTESFFSTQYTTSGQAVLEVLWVKEIVTVTAPETTTVYVPGRKRHVHRHLKAPAHAHAHAH
jgi:hypothetical protein